MKTPALRAAAPLALCSLLLTACGGSALSSGMYPQEPLPATADGTMDVLDRAENDLRLALGTTPPPSATVPPSGYAQPGAASAEPGPPPPPAPVSPSPQAEQRDERPSSVASGPTALASAPCVNACRALASMERATTHLCSLAGDADPRCEGARTRVKSATARVQSECPACSGS